ncbi:FYB2 isoform 1 [Pan troglodytes]|uniref:FYN-binding protein 2 n=1 Tax=Pan troglodytes TaxID=9598 RepID=A0A2J8NHW5_PANTR|nr:FYB2 isoform 1 [Pan troglodytes]
MPKEGVRNFKELRAKFQNLDAPPLPGPIKFPAGVSPKGDIGGTQSTQILANEKPLPSNHKQRTPYCSSSESQPLQPQKIKLAQKSEIPKCSNAPGPLGKSTVCSAASSQKASLLLEVTQSNVEIITKEKVMVANSFRNKLWNWEKVSSQKSEMSSALLLANCGSKAIHLEGQKGMGLTPEEPRKKLETKGAQTLPSQKHVVAPKILRNVSEDPSFVISQHIRKSWENLPPERSPASSPCQPIYECELASQAPEKQPDVRHHHLPKTKPLPSIDSLGPPPPKPSRPPVMNLQAFQRQPAAVPKTQGEVTVEEGSLSPERLFNAEFEEPHNYEATISYLRHSGNSINLCTAKEIADRGYLEVLESTKETPDLGVSKTSSISEEIYDDVEYSRKEVPKLNYSSSFASNSEENRELYEDVYKTKNNYPKIDLDGKEALKRLQQFFKKEKDRFKIKKTKSKENLRNFFKTKKQNLEKNRMKREEKLFRERFKYDKEIIVINTAVACSNNSRNGIFDLPISPGEELEVIDTAEQNLVICRNSKGKYGYVLIEHLDFKHQSWSP